ncbi:MAG: hypothetical protein COB79_01690 [Zetaproteobacteria bacterium]|nr:MAG: hypothetical protein COB79_01690 [Zetaproteobacteria bacterium]
MFGQMKNLFTPAKTAAKRISGLVLSVFMLQIVAAGFCVTTASAAPSQQVSNMEHCMVGNMQASEKMSKMDINQNMATHACSHCDMPDVSIAFDKHTFEAADMAAIAVVLAIVPTVSDVQVSTFLEAPPNILSLQNNLSTYNLNLRFRV